MPGGIASLRNREAARSAAPQRYAVRYYLLRYGTTSYENPSVAEFSYLNFLPLRKIARKFFLGSRSKIRSSYD